jgi:electron transfer flavoprotein alpha/beta subunit
VLTIQYGINQPRYASLVGIMAAKKKEFKVWTAADLGMDQLRRNDRRPGSGKYRFRTSE